MQRKFLLIKCHKIAAFFICGFVATFFSIELFAQSYNAISSQISKKNLETPFFPVFVLNGITNFSFSKNYQSNLYEAKTLPDSASKNYIKNPENFGNDTQLFAKIGIKDQENRVFGAIAKVEFNYNTNGRNESPNLDQSFLFLESDFGRLEFGNYFAVNQKMKSGPAQIARGAGGINGKYLEQVNFPMLGNSSNSNAACSGGFTSAACSNVKLPRFITLSQSPIGHGGYGKSFYRFGSRNDYPFQSYDYTAFNHSNFRALKDDSYDGLEDAAKFSFYSSRIDGLQFGLSYAPSSKANGATKKTALDVDEIALRNIFSYGINYSKSIDNLDLKLFLTGEKAKQDNSQFSVARRNLNSYDFGGVLSYFGFSLGASFGSWGKSLQPKNGTYSCNYDPNLTIAAQNCSSQSSSKFKNAGYNSIGLSYEIGPFGASITSLRSNFQNNKYEATSFGIDYKIKKNLVSYVELTKFSFKTNQPKAQGIIDQNSLSNNQRQIANNSGNVLLVGTSYIF